MQGGLTVWNRHADASVEITAEITNVSVGSEQTPVRGSGVFVGGHGTDDGKASGGTLTMLVMVLVEVGSRQLIVAARYLRLRNQAAPAPPGPRVPLPLPDDR